MKRLVLYLIICIGLFVACSDDDSFGSDGSFANGKVARSA